MKRIGLSSISSMERDYEWAFDLPDHGFSALEIIAEGKGTLTNEWCKRITDIKESTGLTITVHAPFSDINIASLNDAIWKESINQIITTIELTSDFSSMLTLHPGHLSPMSLNYPEIAKERVIGALKTIARRGEELGIVIGVENMVNMRFMLCRTRHEIEEIVESVGKNVGITFDVGHAHTNNEVDDFLKSEMIVHVHIHDNDGTYDAHLPIGMGTIDWKCVIENL